MKKECEYEIGTTTTQDLIWLRIKGKHSERFFYHHIGRKEAVELIHDLKQVIKQNDERENPEEVIRIENIGEKKKIETKRFSYRRN